MIRRVVGREAELGSVSALLDDSVDGPMALVLEGEPGIGKSTVWLAGVATACERGLLVLSSRPAEAERDLVYAVVGDLFEPVLDDVAPRLTMPRRRALEAALLLDHTTPEATDPRALGLAVRDALELLANEHPPVIAIDDLQWVDAASASAIAFALRRLGASPVRLLLARRLAIGAPRSEVEEALPDENVLRLSLGPLSVGALHAFLRERLDRVFARQTLLRIHEQSGGNPFFALELARALGSEIDPTQPLPVPQTLDDLVRSRLAGLAPSTRDALGLAAALGAPSVDQLVRAGVDPRALDAALAAQVIERDGGLVRFTHPLLSSALYADLAGERQKIHRRIAEIVDDPLARARHLALATELADGEVAALVEKAAQTATERGAAAVAAELAEQALRLTPSDALDDRHRRVLAAARAERAAGEWMRAKTIVGDLLAEGDVGPMRAEALVLLAELEGLDRAVTLLEEALREAEARPALQAAIHTQLAWTTRFKQGFVSALDHARTALGLADELDDNRLRLEALDMASFLGAAVGDPEVPAYAARAEEIAIALDDPELLGRARSAAGVSLSLLRDVDALRALCEEDYREWRDRDEPRAADALYALSTVELWAGRWDLAADYAARAQETKLQYGLEVPWDHLPIAIIAAHRGQLELARAHSERGLRLGQEQIGLHTPVHLATLGLVAFQGGDLVTAVEWFGKSEAQTTRLGWGEPSNRWWVPDHVEALLELGRLDDAVPLLDRWEADARRLGRDWLLADVTRCRGLVAAAQGAVDEAATLLGRAAAGHGARGDRYGAARSLLALGVVCRRMRQKRAAREAIAAALADFERLGAQTWSEKARAELGRIGGRRREPGLTAAERRVAALVAEGRTNREVAAALFLGERTVETHLSHVYAKLGVRSRAELARTFRGDEQSSGELTISS